MAPAAVITAEKGGVSTVDVFQKRNYNKTVEASCIWMKPSCGSRRACAAS